MWLLLWLLCFVVNRDDRKFLMAIALFNRYRNILDYGVCHPQGRTPSISNSSHPINRLKLRLVLI